MARISSTQVKHVALLANLPLTAHQIKKFPPQLSSILDYVSKTQQVDTKNISETSQVTNLENITREDKVQPERILSQSEALSNASKTHNGYFVVKSIL